jgi:GINS complex subunit 4
MFDIINDTKYLERIWQNEKFSKDILHFDDRVLDILKKIEIKEEEVSKAKKNDDLELVELDIERLKYMIKEYLRIRMAKIEKYLYHIIKNDLCAMLSNAEFEFASQLFKHKKAYFDDVLYKKINPSLNDFKINGEMGNINQNFIVNSSDNSYVIAKSVVEEPIMVNLRDAFEESLETKTFTKDEIYCLPYKLIKDNLRDNHIELI